MMHANKMLLVPHETVGESESTKQLISNLDKEMMKILQDTHMADDEKMIKYKQVLQRHQSAVREKEKHFQLEIREQPTEFLPLSEGIVETIPPKWRNQAAMLLQYTRKNPHMKWSEKGELIINGNKILGSNIIDLINDFSHSRKTKPVIGAESFLEKLLADNVPMEAIVNKNRLNLIDKEVHYATPSPNVTPVIDADDEKQQTPVRIGRKIGRKKWQTLKL
jgi:hypothetical protein